MNYRSAGYEPAGISWLSHPATCSYPSRLVKGCDSGAVCGFLVTLAVLAVLVRRFDVWYVTANVVGIGVGFFVNYTCESLYTWQVHQE